MAEPQTFAQAWAILTGQWANSEKRKVIVLFLKQHADRLTFEEQYQLRGALTGLMRENLVASTRGKPATSIPGALTF